MRAGSMLAVALLVPCAALAAPPPPVDEAAPHAATVVIDFAPDPGVPAWFASSFEQTITHELAGFERLASISKQEVALAMCGAGDHDCRLEAYRAAGVDIVLFGAVGADTIAYELYQTWTPARLDTGTIDVGPHQSLVGLEHATRDAFHVVLKHGGLLDQKPYALEHASVSDNVATGGTVLPALVVIALLLLPFGLALISGEAPARLARMRSARRAAIAIGAILLAVVLDPRRIAALCTELAPLVAGIGGLGWGAFLVVVVRTAFPPLDGLERVPHGELLRFLGTWCIAALERLVALAVVYAPLVALVAWVGSSFSISPQWIYLLFAPTVIWLARVWFASWVECVAAWLDRRLVEGVPTDANPWSREVRDYVMGYVRRTGWDLDPDVLARVVFLPGKRSQGVVSYGGGPTHVRIVIDRELLVMAMGPLVEAQQDEKPAMWPDWTLAGVGPRMARIPTQTSPRDFRKPQARYPGIVRKPLGQAATLLGYALPAPGELIPLISDNPQDLAIVRELLSEHYPWFAPDPDEEYDATDPTDKDLLFGALVYELGAVRRNETQLGTLRLALRIPRLRPRLADSYAALNFARHHLIQYLYYRWTKDEKQLTARARPAQLHAVSKQILREAAGGKAPRAIHARLAYLSRFFAEPIVDRRGVLARRIAAGVVTAVLVVAAGIAVKRSIDYHSVYLERVHKKGPADGKEN